MTDFIEIKPSLDSYWRSIVLFGRNVASYKFALAKSLIDIADENKAFVRLDELAIPFSQHISEHLVNSDKQGTSASSKFLDICRKSIKEEVSKDELISSTAKLGFVNVIDAFHIVNQGEIPKRFFIDDRKTKQGITLTDEIFKLKEDFQYQNLPNEIEARWRLVETAWALDISPNLLEIKFDKEQEVFYAQASFLERTNITSCKDSLNGYQKGKCFYCYSNISIDSKAEDLADVDHFFPHILKSMIPEINIDGVWNLVLACKSCNRGSDGKFTHIPEKKYLNRLNTRNSYLIESHHPLRETLINQTGRLENDRRKFLRQIDNIAISRLFHRWSASHEEESCF